MIRLSSPLSRDYQFTPWSARDAGSGGRPKWEEFRYWLSYFHQVNEVLKHCTKGSRILEIGPGNFFTTDVLRRLRLEVVTLDMDPESSADLICDVRYLNLEARSFDVTCAFQVLEHVPFADFRGILAKLCAATRRACILSLPEPGLEIGAFFKMSHDLMPRWFRRFGEAVSLSAKFCYPTQQVPSPLPGHQWTVGRRGFSRRNIEREINAAGFRIVRRFNPPLSMYFLFYILEPIHMVKGPGES